MKAFLLVGHTGFQNRGCEAIVQSTRAMLRERFGSIRVILSSWSPENDTAFTVPGESEVHPGIPGERSTKRYMGKLLKVCGLLHLRARLRFGHVLEPMAQVDAVLSVGGDLYSMDYGFPADHLYLNTLAYRAGKPLVVWGASIGPFPDERVYAEITGNLKRASLITVRESLTKQDLEDHGVTDNVRQVCDPAFVLAPAPVDLSPFWPHGDGVLGLNVAPVLGNYRDHAPTAITEAAAELTRKAVDEYGLGVLLVPHVVHGTGLANERGLMRVVEERAARPGRVSLLPGHFTAAQTKFAISQCRLLMATRTHATIAGFSTGVPTVSLSRSRKALGINQDLFGDSRYVCDVTRPDVEKVLVQSFERLLTDEDAARQLLEDRQPELVAKAWQGVEYLAALLSH